MITAVRRSIWPLRWPRREGTADITIHITTFAGIKMKGIFKSRRPAFSSRLSGRLRPVVIRFRYLEMGRNMILSIIRKETYTSSKKKSRGINRSKKEGPLNRDRYASLSVIICSGVAKFNMPTMTIPMVTERAPMA
jgi:hypothetical protein